MSHDLRNALGYRHIPAQDPEEQRLRDELFRARADAAQTGVDTTTDATEHMLAAEKALADYIWDRTCREVAADRAKHPKAKRNMPVGSALPGHEKSGAPSTPHIEGFTQPDPRGIAK